MCWALGWVRHNAGITKAQPGLEAEQVMGCCHPAQQWAPSSEDLCTAGLSPLLCKHHIALLRFFLLSLQIQAPPARKSWRHKAKTPRGVGQHTQHPSLPVLPPIQKLNATLCLIHWRFCKPQVYNSCLVKRLNQAGDLHTFVSDTVYLFCALICQIFCFAFPTVAQPTAPAEQGAERLSALLWKANSSPPMACTPSVPLPKAYKFDVFCLKERGKPTPKARTSIFLFGSRWWGGAGRERANRKESKRSIHNASPLPFVRFGRRTSPLLSPTSS